MVSIHWKAPVKSFFICLYRIHKIITGNGAHFNNTENETHSHNETEEHSENEAEEGHSDMEKGSELFLNMVRRPCFYLL